MLYRPGSGWQIALRLTRYGNKSSRSLAEIISNVPEIRIPIAVMPRNYRSPPACMFSALERHAQIRIRSFTWLAVGSLFFFTTEATAAGDHLVHARHSVVRRMKYDANKVKTTLFSASASARQNSRR
jgi:hypothetical protein